MDGAYMKPGKWMQRERSFLTAHLLPKGIVQACQQEVLWKEIFLTTIYQRQNMDSAVHIAVLKHTLPHKVRNLLCEKPIVLRNAPASENQPELT